MRRDSGVLLSRIFRLVSGTAIISFFPLVWAQQPYVPLTTFEENLARPEISWLIAAGTFFLGAAFTVTLVMQVFRIIAGTETVGALFRTLALYLMLFFLYTYGGRFMSEVASLIVTATAGSAAEVAEAYTAFDEATMRLAFGPSPKEAGGDGIVTGKEQPIASLTPPLLWGLIFAFLFKGLLLFALAIKFLLLTILWPLVHQLTLLGFVFAVPFAAFAGWEPIKRFAVTVVEVSIWPVIYNIGFGVAAHVSTPLFTSFDQIMQEQDYETLVGTLLAHLSTIAPLIGHFLFLIALGTLTPAIAAMIVRSTSSAAIAQALSRRISGFIGGHPAGEPL